MNNTVGEVFGVNELYPYILRRAQDTEGRKTLKLIVFIVLILTLILVNLNTVKAEYPFYYKCPKQPLGHQQPHPYCEVSIPKIKSIDFYGGAECSPGTVHEHLVRDPCESYETLIITSLERMRNIGYDSKDVNELKSKLKELQKKLGKTAIIDFDIDTKDTPPFNYEENSVWIKPIADSYSFWIGNESDVTKTNNLVKAIDEYIERWKNLTGSNLKYIIIVGSHEIIPMYARPDDYYVPNGLNDNNVCSEKEWANGKDGDGDTCSYHEKYPCGSGETGLPKFTGYIYI